jgi:hypothetical protein
MVPVQAECITVPVRDGLIAGHAPLTIDDDATGRDTPDRGFAVYIDMLTSDEASALLKQAHAIRNRNK